MPRPPSRSRCWLALVALSLTAAACSDAQPRLLTPDDEPLTAAAPAPATDAEVIAAHVRAHGRSAVIW